MRYRYRKRNWFLIIFLIVIFVSVGYGFIMRQLKNPFQNAFAAYAAEVGNRAVNNAVEECLSDISYADLVVINKDTNGQIVSMTSNGIKISILKSRITQCIENFIDSYKNKHLSLNIGSAQNNILLSGIGPRLKVKISPVSVTNTQFRDEFVSAGINQVRHCIYLDITLSVTISSLNVTKTQNITNSVLVTDTVIVGQVPNFYGSYIPQLNDARE